MSEELTTIARELRAGRPVVVSTTGVSMRPLLWEGKTQVLVCPPDHPPRVGELSLFLLREGVYVMHRIIAVEDGFCITRGDNCLGTERVPEERILGLAAEIYRGRRTLSVTDRRYRVYVKLWQLLTPLRLAVYRLRSLVRAVLGKLRHCA